jgi:hypothetical protein
MSSVPIYSYSYIAYLTLLFFSYWVFLLVSRVEARYNTSTVALRVVEGDEKETRCLGI